MKQLTNHRQIPEIKLSLNPPKIEKKKLGYWIMIIAPVIEFVFAYLTGSFAFADFNIANWPADGRESTAATYASIAVLTDFIAWVMITSESMGIKK